MIINHFLFIGFCKLFTLNTWKRSILCIFFMSLNTCVGNIENKLLITMKTVKRFVVLCIRVKLNLQRHTNIKEGTFTLWYKMCLTYKSL